MKRILAIGATSAIASACCRLWAADGARFFLVARDPVRLASVADDLVARGAHAVASACLDVTDRNAMPITLAAAAEALGGFDIALVAHGTLPDQAACEADVDATLRALDVNGTATLAVLSWLAPHFERQGHGALAVITSVAGDRGRPSNYVYGSAKAMVATFCEGLRARLHGRGVTLTDIRPGFVATPMTAGLALPAPLVAQPAAIAPRIVRAIACGKDVIYVPAFWWPIMFVIRHLPRALFKRLRL